LEVEIINYRVINIKNPREYLLSWLNMLSLFSELKNTLHRVSSIKELKTLLTTDYNFKESQLYYGETDHITEFEALFISKIILDELKDHFKEHPKKISHEFIENIWLESDKSDTEDEDDKLSNNLKEVWQSEISNIIIKKVSEYATYDDKYSEIALCKWACKFIMLEYVDEITKKVLLLFVDEITKKSKISKKLINIFRIIKLKLSLCQYKKFSKNNEGFSVINEIPECTVSEIVKIIDKLLKNDKDLLLRPDFLISLETNPETFSKIPDKIPIRISSVISPIIDMDEECCCWFY
jgi:hypothetical protein